jgi:excisionase family DNA binding protein
MSASATERIGPKAVGARLGVCAQTVRDMIRRQELPAIRVSKQFRVRVEDVDDYIAKQAASNTATGDQP